MQQLKGQPLLLTAYLNNIRSTSSTGLHCRHRGGILFRRIQGVGVNALRGVNTSDFKHNDNNLYHID